MNKYSDEWCVEMLRQLLREERAKGRITEEEAAAELRMYLFKTTPPPEEDTLSTLKTPTVRNRFSR